MHIRQATEIDIATIAPLVIAFRKELAKLKNHELCLSESEAHSELKSYFNKKYSIFVAEDELHQIIGYLVCKIEEDVVWAESIYVIPEYRRQQIASSLYEQVEKTAKELGNDTVYNWVHPNNDKIIKFLEKHGYNVLNLIELRRPYEKELNKKNIKIGKHKFKY
ncbi:MAG: GNAT family N-acetyltransferase [bacterium]|nr:GNAT family N-acetyltransferase [bacterium]